MTTSQAADERSWKMVSDTGFKYRFVAMDLSPRGGDAEEVAQRLRSLLTADSGWPDEPSSLRVIKRNKGFSIEYADPKTGRRERLVDIPESFNRQLREEFARGSEWALRKVGQVVDGKIHGSIRRCDVVHGTLSAYQNGRCRCDECKEANRLRHLERRGGYHPRMGPNDHSGATCAKRGCTCEIRRKWEADRAARRRARQRAARATA